MTTRQGGARKGCRSKLRKRPRDSGKVTISRLLQEFKTGDKVSLSLEPAVQKGMPHPRYFGRIGKIVKKQGAAYIVEIKDGNKIKRLIASAVHLKKQIQAG